LAQSANIQEAWAGLTAADAVLDQSPVINANSTLRHLADRAILSRDQSPWQRFLVQDAEDQLVGSIDLDILQTVPSTQWSESYVQNYLMPMSQETQVKSDRSLLDVISQLETQGIQALAVIRENGTLVGLLEKSTIIHLLKTKHESQPA